MKVVKKLENMKIFKKENGRFAVKNAQGKFVNGEEKAQILLKEGLIKLSEPKKEEAPVEEPASEETPAEETEA